MSPFLLAHSVIIESTIDDFYTTVKIIIIIILAIGKDSDFKKEAIFFFHKIAKELLEKRIIRWKK